MTTARKGQQIFIDPVIAEKAMAIKPGYLTKTGWINHLVDVGILAMSTSITPAQALSQVHLGGK